MVDSLLEVPFKYYNKLGMLLPNGPNKIQKLLLVGVLTYFTALHTVGVLQLVYVDKSDLFAIMDVVLLLAGTFQTGTKIFFLVLNKNQMMVLIESSKKFWDTAHCSQCTTKKVTKLSQTVRKLQVMYISYVCFILALLIVLTVLIPNSGLLLDPSNLKNHPKLYKVAKFINLSGMFPVGVYATLFDSLFVGCCGAIQLQFKILCDRIQQFSVEKIDSQKSLLEQYKELKVFIKHHTFLLEFIDAMGKFYSPSLMVQYVTSACLISSNFYVIFESPNIVTVITEVILLVYLVLQLAMYSLPFDYLAKEANNVAQAVYASEWYLKHFKIFKVPLQLMIMRSQREERFLAGGFIIMNIQTLITVIKFSFSLNTLLRNMRNDKN